MSFKPALSGKSESNISIKTPGGESKGFSIKNIIMQGTVWGVFVPPPWIYTLKQNCCGSGYISRSSWMYFQNKLDSYPSIKSKAKNRHIYGRNTL